jgi:8-oxo-dGTP diphosphatase
MRNSNTIYHRTAGAFLLDKSNRILLSKREFCDGTTAWVNAKGHINDGESDEAAAIREVAEETGYTDIQIVCPLGEEEIRYKERGSDHIKSIKWFYARLKSEARVKQSLSKSEIGSFKDQKWFSLDEALDILSFNHDRECVLKIKRMLASN